LNPFVLARLELESPRPAGEALGALEQLLRDGLEAAGRRYRLFGGRRGHWFTMSLGMPLLGGGAPVLRARLPEAPDAGPSRFAITVAARAELIVFASFWVLLTVLGGGYQLLLQLVAVAAGRGTPRDVIEVLPGIGIMAGLLALGFWLFRRRAATDTTLMLAAFRRAVGVPEPGEAAVPPPLH
jgi:hypothetical protein